MKSFTVLCSMFLIFATMEMASAEDIDFCGFSPGDSIEGLGTVHPLLNISSSNGEGRAIFDGESSYSAYGAPNGDDSRSNGCIECGFSDLSPSRRHDFVFTFADNVTVTSFFLRMLDYGDLNKGAATQHMVRMEAYNSCGVLVDFIERTHTSTPDSNPRSGSEGDLLFTGDACTAEVTQLGKYAFLLQGTDITLVKLIYSHNGTSRPQNIPSDPKIGFDHLNITFYQPPCDCTDSDGDGVPDAWDECLDTPQGSAVYSNGCSSRPGDFDGDGDVDGYDLAEFADVFGCPF